MRDEFQKQFIAFMRMKADEHLKTYRQAYLALTQTSWKFMKLLEARGLSIKDSHPAHMLIVYKGETVFNGVNDDKFFVFIPGAWEEIIAEIQQMEISEEKAKAQKQRDEEATRIYALYMRYKDAGNPALDFSDALPLGTKVIFEDKQPNDEYLIISGWIEAYDPITQTYLIHGENDAFTATRNQIQVTASPRRQSDENQGTDGREE